LSVSKLIPLQTGNDYPRDLHWVTRWRVSQNDHLIEAGRDEIADHPLDISENIAGAMVNTGLKLRLGEGQLNRWLTCRRGAHGFEDVVARTRDNEASSLGCLRDGAY
jgi:hypothetical protein